MAEDFLVRLFRYKERENRTPLEDFLTEAFVELLNQLSKVGRWTELGELIAWNGMPQIENMTWEAQFVISLPEDGLYSGRPDIVGMGKSGQGESIFVLIENKINAGFTFTGENREGQLNRYQRYLYSRTDRYKLFMLLTHLTLPPCEIGEDLRVLHWREIAKTLGSWIEHRKLKRYPLIGYLANCIWKFLKENQMDKIEFDMMTIASITSFHNLVKKINDLGKIVEEEVEKSGISNFFEKNGLGRKGRSGEFSYSDYGPSFFGRIWTNKKPDGKAEKIDDAAIIFWAGIWLRDIYGIRLKIEGVPELSIGVVVWLDDSDDVDDDTWQKKREEVIMMLNKLRLDGCELVELPEKKLFNSAIFKKKALTFTEAYRTGIDWSEVARGFATDALGQLCDVDNKKVIRALTEWSDVGEDGDGGDESGDGENAK